MNKTKLLDQFSKDSDSRKLFASSLDRLSQSQSRNQLTVTDFFSPEEQGQFSALLSSYGGTSAQFFGGFPQAERAICCFLPDWLENLSEIPVSDPVLTVLEGSISGEISHRDVLGSLMGLGLSRRKIGDILIFSEKPYRVQVLCLPETASLLLSQWSSVGRYPISLREIPLSQLEVPEQEVKELTSTVASLRLDSLVSTGFSISRTKASSLISSGKVFLNHQECQKPERILVEGDKLTCRGLGKCVVTEVKGLTKKGRTLVTMERYL